MRIGIVSDTHGSGARASRAARLLADAGVGQVFHCGDIGSEEVLVEMASILAPRGIRLCAVLGNVDLYRDDLYGRCVIPGVELFGRFASITVDGKRIALLHGDDEPRMRGAIREGFDFVFLGHTHQADARREGAAWVINPGAAYRSARPSVAVVEFDPVRVEFLSLEAGSE